MIEKQELFCHECQQYVQFEIDTNLEGNHILNCPNCGHEHCRVVKNGNITDERWGQRNKNMQNFFISPTLIGTSSTSTYDRYMSGGTAGSSYLYGSWMNTTAATS